MSAWTDRVASVGIPDAWWRHEETSGLTMSDHSGNARHGAYSAGGPVVNQLGDFPGDPSGLAVRIDSGRGSVAYGAWMDPSPNNKFSVFSIFKARTLSAANVLVARDTQSAGRRWQLQINSAGSLNAIMINGAGTAYNRLSNPSYGTGWHMGVITFDATAGSTSNAWMHLYADGVADESFPGGSGGANIMANTGTPGIGVGDALRTTTVPAHADIAETGYYVNRVLTPAEIAELWLGFQGVRHMAGWGILL